MTLCRYVRHCFSLPQTASETQLSLVRQRCVRLLGALGGSVNSVLVQTSHDELARHLVAWDMDKHLKFDVPFMDVKPTIYFGE